MLALMKFRFLFLLFIVVLFGCASQPVSFQFDEGKSRVKSDYFTLCLDFAGETAIEDKLLYLDAVKSFIDEYNEAHAKDEIRACVRGNGFSQSRSGAQIRLIIQSTRYVSPGEQALYVLISGAGLYSLLNGGYGFAWAGLSSTTLGIVLSGDMASQPKVVYRQFRSWPYFQDMPGVKRKHMEQFQVFMFKLLSELKVESKP